MRCECGGKEDVTLRKEQEMLGEEEEDLQSDQRLDRRGQDGVGAGAGARHRSPRTRRQTKSPSSHDASPRPW